jgi:putative ABC transport system permease protein
MLYHYIRSFLKSIRKNRFFYTINLIGFVTGFLVITMIITFVYQELSFDKFHKNANNIYRITAGSYGVTPSCFAEKLKNQVPEITAVARFSARNLSIVSNNKDVNIGRVFYTDQEVFRIFSFKLYAGNPTNVLINTFSIVIDRSTSSKLFGPASPLGEIIREKDGTAYTITGIMEDIPYNSHIKGNAFISFETLKQISENKTSDCRNWSILTYVCLSEKTNVRETEGKINSELKDFLMGPTDNKIPLKLEQFRKVYFDYNNNKYDGSEHGNLQIVKLYLATSFLILVIVIINYINLTSAISGSRIKEIAIRRINGAERGQIVKRELLEALGMAFLSFITAFLLIKVLLPQLSSLLNIPVSQSVKMPFLYIYCFLAVAATGIIAGIFPGVFLSKVNEIRALKNELLFKKGGQQRKILLFFQLFIVATSLNLTFSINRQIKYVLNKDLGFNYENIVYMKLDKDLYGRKAILKNNLLKNPKIKSVAFSDGLIGEGFGKSTKKIGETEKLCNFFSIDPAFLNLYQIKIKYGRNFSFDLMTDYSNSCLVNETACRAFGVENPVGKLVGNKEIIGVVNDFNFTSLHNRIEPLIINCAEGNIVQLKISSDNRDATLNSIMQLSKELSPDFKGEYSYMENRIRELYKSEINLKSSFILYSIITLIISSLGLFGLTLFLIRKKTREISIRKLYGAKLSDTFKLFIAEQVRIVVISNMVAIPISIFANKAWLNYFQYRVDIGFLIYLETLLITLVFTILAISFFIVKTHRTNLIETLNHE